MTLNNKYIEYFKIGFKKSIEYKSYIIGTLITPIFMGFFFFFLWSYIFAAQSAGDQDFTIGGFTFEEMIIYLIIGLLINSAKSSDISNKISEVIKTGDISIFLCRPVNFVKALLFEGLGTKIIPLLMFTILLSIMTKIFGLPFPTGTILIIFLIYAILMLLFDIILYILIGGLSFWFIEIWGIKASIEQILWILSGRVLPLTLFPTIFQSILTFTPFLYLEFTFANIYLGKLEVIEALFAMGIFIFWILILLLFTRWIYKKGFSKLTSYGG